MILIITFSGLTLPHSMPEAVCPIMMTLDANVSFSGGSGTLTDPYQISNVTHLQNMSSDLSAHYILVNNIDASDTEDWNDGKGFLPIGHDIDPNHIFDGEKFTGSLNGDLYTISDLCMQRPNECFVGLIAYCGSDSIVKDLKLTGVKIIGSRMLGGITGHLEGKLDNCDVEINISGIGEIGGLAGYVEDGQISGCRSEATMEQRSDYYYSTGGIAGKMEGGVIRQCYANTTTNGGEAVGGILGTFWEGRLEDCYSNVDIKEGIIAGGLIGMCSEQTGQIQISSSRSSGTINSSESGSIGGLIGTNGWLGTPGGTIYDCSFHGNVTGYSEVGGLIGRNLESSISYCHSSGNVIGGMSVIGGLIGSNGDDRLTNGGTGGSITYCYSICNVSGVYRYIGGLIGLNLGAQISNCHSNGMVTGNRSVGGLIGNNGGQVYGGGMISRCYSSARVKGEIEAMTGGLVSFSGTGGFASNSFWDIDSSGQNISKGGGTGLPSIKMTLRSTYSNVGWDMYSTWSIVDKRTYPYLSRNGNVPVRIIDPGDQETDENESFELKVQFYDPDIYDATPLWTMETNANWIEIDERTGTLSGIPENNDVGTWSFSLTATDGEDLVEFEIEVLNVNDPPVILTQDIITVYEDMQYSVQYNAVDHDPTEDTITWEMETDAGWLGLDTTSGLLEGIPSNDDVGLYSVNISAIDDYGDGTYRIFELEVLNPIKDAPTDVVIIAESNYMDGGDQIVDSSVTDVDIPFADELTFSWSSNISGEIGEGQSINLSLPAGHHLITLTVTDSYGLSETATMEIEIKPVEEDNRNGGVGSNDLLIALILIIAIIIIVLIVLLVIFFLVRKSTASIGMLRTPKYI